MKRAVGKKDNFVEGFLARNVHFVGRYIAWSSQQNLKIVQLMRSVFLIAPQYYYIPRLVELLVRTSCLLIS